MVSVFVSVQYCHLKICIQYTLAIWQWLKRQRGMEAGFCWAPGESPPCLSHPAHPEMPLAVGMRLWNLVERQTMMWMKDHQDWASHLELCPVSCPLISRKRRVVVLGDPLLKGAVSPTHQLDPCHREVHCLTGAWAWILVENSLARYGPKIIFHYCFLL